MAGEPTRLIDEAVPSRARGAEHRLVIAKHAMREEALAQVKPHAFHRIEFGRGCRQRQKRDVVRHGKRRRDVPAGPVEEQDGVPAGCQLLREGGEEHRHGLGGRAWQGEGEGRLGAGRQAAKR